MEQQGRGSASGDLLTLDDRHTVICTDLTVVITRKLARVAAAERYESESALQRPDTGLVRLRRVAEITSQGGGLWGYVGTRDDFGFQFIASGEVMRGWAVPYLCYCPSSNARPRSGMVTYSREVDTPVAFSLSQDPPSASPFPIRPGGLSTPDTGPPGPRSPPTNQVPGILVRSSRA